MQQRGAAGLVQLSPEAAHGHVDHSVHGGETGSHLPDVAGQQVPRNGAILEARQIGEEVQFAGAQRQRSTAAFCAPRHRVHHQVVDTEDRGYGLHATQNGGDAGVDLDEGEGLDDIVIRPDAESFQAIGDRATRGDDDDGWRRRTAEVVGQQVESIAVGECQVQQQEVGLQGAHQLPRLTHRARRGGAVALPLQAALECPRQIDVVARATKSERAEPDIVTPSVLETRLATIDTISRWHPAKDVMPACLVHNDFRPHNIVVRESGQVSVLDWSLARVNTPQRDAVELLVNTLDAHTDVDELLHLLAVHWQALADNGLEVDPEVYARAAAAEFRIYSVERLSLWLLLATELFQPDLLRLNRTTDHLVGLTAG